MATPSGGSDAEPPRAQQRSLRPPKAPANVCRPVNVLPPVAGLHVEHHDAKKNRWLSYRLHGDIITDLKLQGYGACALDSCKEVCIGVLKGLLAAVDVKYEKGQLKGGLSLFMQVPSMRLTFEHPQVKYALRKSVSAYDEVLAGIVLMHWDPTLLAAASEGAKSQWTLAKFAAGRSKRLHIIALSTLLLTYIFFGEAPFKGAEPPVLPFLLISRFTR